MRRKLVLFLLVAVAVVLVGGCFSGNLSEGKEGNLLNIAELPEEFMNSYFDEYRSVESEEAKENMLIVTSLEGVVDSYGATSVIAAPNNQYILLYESEEVKNEAMDKFRDDDSVLAVDVNEAITLSEVDYRSWGIEKAGMDVAIGMANGRDLPEVRVAVIDSGCDVDLINKYYSGKITETYNALSDSTVDMWDSYGHGTHVAGIVAEATPENVKVVPVKATDGKTLWTSDVIAAVNYVVYQEKADVINMSFGLYNYNTALYNAIAAADQKKIVTVAAAGNDNTSRDCYPAAFDNTISIASVDSQLNKSSFSNYNSTVDFAAPGTRIKSTLSNNMTLSKGADGDDDFEVMSGTSMATPHAASAVAMLKSYNGDLGRGEVVGLLKEYATRDLGVVGKDEYYGNGLIYFRPGSFCTDLSEGECEEYGVFKTVSKVDVSGFEVIDVTTTDRNYGTVNNLNSVQVLVRYSDGFTLMANLGDLSGVEITEYDPYATEEQEVTVEWQGERVSFRLTNPSDWESGWKYEVIGERIAKITGFVDFNGSDFATKKLYVPETLDGYEIVEIAGTDEGDAVFNYANKTSYEEIVLPVTLGEISGSQTFRAFNSVKKVTSLAPSLRITGDNVFGENKNLEEVVGVISELGVSTFIGDTSLRSVTLSDEMKEITPNAFNNCSALREIELPRALEVIGDFAFYGTSLVDVDLPDSMVRIGEYAFYNTNLEKVYVPESVEKIGAGAFVGKDGYIVIWTYADTYAERYAVENEIPYVLIERPKVDIEGRVVDYEGVYDGDEHSISIEVDVSEYDVAYSVGNKSYDLAELPKFKEVGEYVVYYKVSAEGYNDFEGSGRVRIYGIKDFSASVVVKDDRLMIQDNSFSLMKDGITAYSVSSEYEHYDKNDELVTTDVLKTGDIVKVMLNGEKAYEYHVVFLGDTSGDGKINYLDYVNVYNHIQKAKHPELGKKLLVDEYLLAADMSGDGKISYLDYVRIYNKIKELKRG